MCDCSKKMDEALAVKNGRLSCALAVTDTGLVSRLIVATEKIDKSKRKPAPMAVASFCPFCGEKIVFA